MDNLVQDHLISMDSFKFDHHLSTIHQQQNHTNSCRTSPDDRDSPVSSKDSRLTAHSTSVGDEPGEDEDYDGILKYIGQILMEEEDLEHKTCMFYDSIALQATEKNFYDALTEPKTSHSSIMEANLKSLDDGFFRPRSIRCSDSSSHVSNWISNPQLEYSPVQLAHLTDAFVTTTLQSDHQFLNSSNGHAGVVNGKANSLESPHPAQDLSRIGQFGFGPRGEAQFDHFHPLSRIGQFGFEPRGEAQFDHFHPLSRIGQFGFGPRGEAQFDHFHLSGSIVVYDPETYETASEVGAGAEERVKNHSQNRSMGKKSRKDTDTTEDTRSNKLLASSASGSDPFDMYNNVFLCPNSNLVGEEELILCSSPKALSNGTMNKLQRSEQSKSSRKSRRRAGKIQRFIGEVVDLRSLLMQCAQAVASYDNKTGNELLRRIKQHSSPLGDATERLAYYFSNALEARLEGYGPEVYTSFISKKFSAAEALMCYRAYITACPFKKMLTIYANKCIQKVASGATRLHIIDFGILCGFKWPSLIRSLSERPEGPPKLRITGVEHPQPGFRPAERVEETGQRLAKYCKKFNVPFEYNIICQNWETIQLKDLLIDRDEVLVVNCLYRLDNLPDETVVTSSPRDVVLKLIKRMKPDIFIHGVNNGTYNSLFYVTRFREALFHFSSLFDMFDASLPRENQGRLAFEKQAFGRDAINIIACEGIERVERPETYKQWQVRILRAGFRQLALDRESLNYVKDKVEKCYHKDSLVGEDGNWMLLGWKGKILQSLSCWEPNKK